jgi:hypothetical protein
MAERGNPAMWREGCLYNYDDLRGTKLNDKELYSFLGEMICQAIIDEPSKNRYPRETLITMNPGSITRAPCESFYFKAFCTPAFAWVTLQRPFLKSSGCFQSAIGNRKSAIFIMLSPPSWHRGRWAVGCSGSRPH